MRLLIITQKVDKNDPVLGFFHQWIITFSKHVDALTVMCLERGDYSFPKNVSVFFLGKPKEGWDLFSGGRIVGRIRALFLFYTFILKERKRYDSVFVHMNPEYIVWGGVVWRLLKKKISLWYVHRSVTLSLWWAEKFSHRIFTSTRESFNLKSSKVEYLGHGIDTTYFSCKKREIGGVVSLLVVGRIAPIKRGETLIESARILRDDYQKDFHITFLGPAVTGEEKKQKEKLVTLLKKYRLGKNIQFIDGVSPVEVKAYICQGDISVNLSPTGGLDKVVIEAMAGGRPVIVSNRAFSVYFGKWSKYLLVRDNDHDDLAKKIVTLHETNVYQSVADFLEGEAKRNFDLDVLISHITHTLKKIKI